MKNKLRAFVFVGLFGCISFFAFKSNIDNPVLDKLVTSLQHWSDSIPQEKVYLHMDKPYYALGDTIWFKGYLTIGSRHQLSKLSGAVYVDLISEKDSLLEQLKLPVTSGMVIGDFILKDDYHQGNYRIRAYTQWMRNAGEDYFFDHTFLVGDVAGGDIVARADFSYRDDKGKLYRRSAICTHMGCIVRFNSAEKTWDCPCHGSRFGVEGHVINSPAISPLASIEEDS